MNNNTIQVLGITPIQDYPSFPLKYPCKQVSQTDSLCIPCQKPDIKDIIQVTVSLSVTSFKVISTTQGDKLIIDGLKHIKIMYTANNDCSSVHSAHFDTPFCQFILLRNSCREVVCIETAIEHIAPHQISCREFAVCTIILLCPVFKKQPRPPHPPKPCNEKPVDCNCCCKGSVGCDYCTFRKRDRNIYRD